MGVQGFQEYLEKRCPGAAVPVDLLKLARTAARQPPHHHHPHHHPHHPGPMPPPPPPARILIDADSGLQRLYGGYQTDWVCGGEWNAMLGYLAALSQACLYQGGLELVVVFNGTLGKERWPEWARRAQGQRQTAQLIVNHVGSKATPPPRAWFLPPACLSHCVRLAMFRFRVRVVQTLEDHHQEVLSLYRDFGFAGLIAQDSEFALCNVRAHQLVLPPCEVVIKAVSEYVSSIKDLGNLDAIARDVFKQSQSRMEDKVERFKKAVEYFSAASKPRSPNMGPSSFILPGFGPNPFGGPPGHMGPMQPGKNQVPGLKPPYQNAPYGPGSTPLFQNPPPPSQDCNDSLTNKMGFSDWSAPYDSTQGGSRLPNHHTSTQSGPSPSPSSSSDGDEPNDSNANHLTDKSSRWEDPTGRGGSASGEGSQGNGSGSNIPSLLSMATRSHMDITTPPLPQVSAEVLRVAEHRHRRGLMYPQIFHILTKGEMKMPVCIEDECNSELPPASLLFRAARQYAYGVLFSLAETHRRLERLALRKRAPLEVPPVIVKEWSSGKAKSALTPELVPALCFREWTCPNLRRLWLGRASEDRSRRTRAFLACLRSDCPALLNPAQVPQHLLLMCCVLRYMMQWPGGRILQRHELDAFLAQAVSSQLYEPDQLQELKVEKVDARGVQLASLFMAGVDTALFINDEELVSKVEKMRQAILEGINLSRPPPPPPPLPPPAFLPPAMGGKLEIAGMVVGQWAGNKPVRGRGGFNMQVVSVGAGRGRGKEIPAKVRGVKKAPANRTQTSPPPPSSTPPKPSEETGSTPEVATQQLNGSSAASAIGQPLELAPLAQPIPCALASRDNQSEGVEVEAPCCLDDCPSDGALQKEE
ncbi:Constitutive coactivator of PPAR-gamma-like protein 2 [Collichthys lucidus]|uniref:Constitutive coactivator of PPAR-gamma-like protein 2 n=1 Tax=Collichthys lucidus TaxID=240159 RepID=A0A4V6APF6_COLLU|nr:Constitutive coactivator of PPAR-gamma-like protein 2 [Collichthys lucidus]